MTRLAQARWTDVGVGAPGVLVVPLGSLEQHGPHLPLATDTIVAAAVCEALHDARPDAALAPALPLGASGEHSAFPGTLSIGTAALTTVLVELVRDACPAWPAVLVVNGHGGNAPALARAQQVCRAEGRLLAVHPLTMPNADAHAGRTETCLLLHLVPHLVDLARAEPGVTTPIATLLPRLMAGGVAAVSPNGVLGDPTGASAAQGRVLFGLLTRGAVVAYDAVSSYDAVSASTGAALSAPDGPETAPAAPTPAGGPR